jgi:hypothetical protein
METNKKTTAQVFVENRYSEFTTIFRIPFKEVPYDEVYEDCHYCWRDLLGSWTDVCIAALESRMDSCVSMLFRNKNNILRSDECQVIFKKSNGHIHRFNHAAFRAMEEMVNAFQKGDWNAIKNNELGVRQLLKALYWIPEEDKKEHGSFGFGQLISCLEEFTFGEH